MATTFTIRDAFDVSIDDYFPKVFFDPDHNAELYGKVLAFESWSVLEQKEEPGGVIVRKARGTPKNEAPTVVKKLIGDGVSYLEDGRFDPKTRTWTYQMVPSKLADKVSIRGRLYVEPRGKGVDRVNETTIEVRVFGVGGAVEAFLEKSTRDTYVKVTEFTRRFIRDRHLAPA